jgi:hypothetical protein
VEFDGDDVKWPDVTEIRTRSLIEYLFTGGIDKQSDRLPLPWFPGRGMLINAISLAALTLLLAAAKQQLEGGALEIRIPAEDDVLEDADERARADQVDAGQAQTVISAHFVALSVTNRAEIATKRQRGACRRADRTWSGPTWSPIRRRRRPPRRGPPSSRRVSAARRRRRRSRPAVGEPVTVLPRGSCRVRGRCQL